MKKRIKKLLSLKKFKLKTPRRLSRTFFIFLCTLAVVTPIVYTIFFVPRKTADAAWYSTSWNKRKKIVVDNSKVSGTTDLTNFPMLISITDGDLKQDAQADGDDILFTSSDGSTKLNHEIERYNNITGELIVWVQIPTLYAVTDTTIYMYYGNSSASSQQSVAATWDTNYKAVYHMNQDPTGSNPSALNSENNTLEGYTNGTRTSDLVEAKIGYGHDFDSAQSDRLEMTDNHSGNNITVSGWIKPDSVNTTNWETFIHKTDTSTNWFDFQMYYQANDADSWNSGTDKPTFRIDFDNGDDLDGDYATEEADGGAVLSTGTWYYLVGTYNGTTLAFYKDGTLTESVTCSSCTIQDSGNRIWVGGNSIWGEYLDGNADEVRISDSGRSGDWITTEYNNQNSPSTFYTFNGEQDKPNVTSVEDPVLYWAMDENNGSTVNDSSSSKNNGTISNATWKTDDLCVSGSCMYFDGTGDYVSRASDNDFDFTYSESFTMMAWFRHGAVASGTDVLLARHNTTGTDGGFKIYMESDGDITCGIDRDSTFGPEDSVTSTAATYDDNQWHHVACVKNGSTSLTLYIDGVSVGTPDTSIATSGTYANSDTMYVGMDGDGSSNGWVGFIDDVKIYRTARSVDQIATELRKGSGIRGAGQVLGVREQEYLSSGLLGYWTFDEDSAASAIDHSGNNNDLTNNNTIYYSNGIFYSGAWLNGTDQYYSSSPTINGIKAISMWARLTNPSNKGLVNLTSSMSITIDGSQELTANGINNATFYVNGVKQAYVDNGDWQYITITFDTPIDADQLYIGRVGSTYLQSVYDEVRIYNKVLTPKEIQSLYNWSPGPISHWSFNENQGQTVSDSTIHANAGNLGSTSSIETTDPTWVRGKYGSALQFDGVNDKVTIGDPSSLDLSVAISVEAWINRSTLNSSYNRIVTKTDSSEASGFMFDLTSSDEVRFRIDSTDCVSNTTISSSNSWHHVTATYEYDGSLFGYIKIYIDGILDKSCSYNLGITTNNDNLVIGDRSDGNSPFMGLIDEVLVYNYALSSSKIIEDMNQFHPIGGSPIGSQILNWRFDEGQGTTANSAVSGRQNGTLTSIASPATSTSGWTSSGKYNKGIVFDGIDDAVILANANASSVNFNTNDPFTISTWIYATSDPVNDEAIVAKWDLTNNQTGYYLLLSNDDSDSTGNIAAFIRNKTTTDSLSVSSPNDSIAKNTWYHVAMTYENTGVGNGDTLKLYINGALIDTQTCGCAPLESTTADFTVGDFDPDDVESSNLPFTGVIDEVQVYNSALTQDEINLVYNANASMNVSNGQVESASTVDGTGNPPIAEWKFDENTGNTSTIDSSGNENTLSMINMNQQSWSRGKYGSSLKFNGTNQYLNRADDSDFDFAAADSFTIETWAKHNGSIATKPDYLIVKASNTSSGYKLYMDASGNFCFAVDDDVSWTPDDSACSSGTNYADNKWHHVVGVKSATSSIKIYVDGSLKTTDSTIAATGTLANSQLLYIGGDLNDGDVVDFWYGLMDQIQIYNYARSASQIVYDYNRGRPLGWWKLDENTGTTAYDSSGNGNNGTFTGSGSLTSVAGKFSYGLSFPANSSCMHVDTSNESPFDITSAITISIWIKSSGFQDAWEAFLSKGDSAWRLTRYNQTNNVGFSTTGLSNVDLQGTINVNDGQWHHVVGVYNGANKYLYVDGKLDTSTAATGSISTNSYNVSIGENLETTGRCFYGILDDARVYNYALSAAQIRILYNEDSILRFAPITGNP